MIELVSPDPAHRASYLAAVDEFAGARRAKDADARNQAAQCGGAQALARAHGRVVDADGIGRGPRCGYPVAMEAGIGPGIDGDG